MTAETYNNFHNLTSTMALKSVIKEKLSMGNCSTSKVTFSSYRSYLKGWTINDRAQFFLS